MQGFGHLSDTPVIVSIFERFGYRFVFELIRNIMVFPVNTHTGPVGERRFFHRFVSLFDIKIADAFQIGFGDNRDGMVTDHTERFVAR